MDLFIHDNFFNFPWQIAFVYDPLGGDEGSFVWRAGKPGLVASLPVKHQNSGTALFSSEHAQRNPLARSYLREAFRAVASVQSGLAAELSLGIRWG